MTGKVVGKIGKERYYLKEDIGWREVCKKEYDKAIKSVERFTMFGTENHECWRRGQHSQALAVSPKQIGQMREKCRKDRKSTRLNSSHRL